MDYEEELKESVYRLVGYYPNCDLFLVQHLRKRFNAEDICFILDILNNTCTECWDASAGCRCWDDE